MKKILTLRNVVLFAAFIIGLIGFFVAFGAGFNMDGGYKLTGLMFGNVQFRLGSIQKSLPDQQKVTATGSLVALIALVVLGILAIVISIFGAKNKALKWILLVTGIVVVLCAITVALIRVTWSAAIAQKTIDLGLSPASKRQEIIEKVLDDFADENAKANGALIVTIICSFLSGAGIIAAAFLKDKKLVK